MTRDRDAVAWHTNGVYEEPDGAARDGYEGRVPTTRTEIEAARREALRALEWRRFRCDELPVRTQ
jgi:hypothetical protein